MFLFYTSKLTTSKYSYIDVIVTMINEFKMLLSTFKKVDSNKLWNIKNKISKNKMSGIPVKNHGKTPQGFLKQAETNLCEITRK